MLYRFIFITGQINNILNNDDLYGSSLRIPYSEHKAIHVGVLHGH